MHLGLVSQRPAELDPTIISQCSTFFVMRMTNDADQALLRSAVSEAAANLLGFVPSLGAQEAIGIGEGMPLVARITFSTLSREEIPQERVGRAGERRAAAPRSEVVRSAIERWRRATTSQTFRSGRRGRPARPNAAGRAGRAEPAGARVAEGSPPLASRWPRARRSTRAATRHCGADCGPRQVLTTACPRADKRVTD